MQTASCGSLHSRGRRESEEKGRGGGGVCVFRTYQGLENLEPAALEGMATGGGAA